MACSPQSCIWPNDLFAPFSFLTKPVGNHLISDQITCLHQSHIWKEEEKHYIFTPISYLIKWPFNTDLISDKINCLHQSHIWKIKANELSPINLVSNEITYTLHLVFDQQTCSPQICIWPNNLFTRVWLNCPLNPNGCDLTACLLVLVVGWYWPFTDLPSCVCPSDWWPSEQLLLREDVPERLRQPRGLQGAAQTAAGIFCNSLTSPP